MSHVPDGHGTESSHCVTEATARIEDVSWRSSSVSDVMITFLSVTVRTPDSFLFLFINTAPSRSFA
ncbi:MAG: hypothetical protein DCC43_11055 [Candidatus Brocadia sp.]|nr:hypothetical protein [Candidatus Brocadia sp. AMX3]OQY98125.1 MAG: hypothetical protein B6D35_12995 [Candidatus Brocadia sp. UTAMX2]RIJ96368.1 MAG: hypothetical protein DCC43_11055 [Candidatus Brocadia sp.]